MPQEYIVNSSASSDGALHQCSESSSSHKGLGVNVNSKASSQHHPECSSSPVASIFDVNSSASSEGSLQYQKTSQDHPEYTSSRTGLIVNINSSASSEGTSQFQEMLQVHRSSNITVHHTPTPAVIASPAVISSPAPIIRKARTHVDRKKQKKMQEHLVEDSNMIVDSSASPSDEFTLERHPLKRRKKRAQLAQIDQPPPSVVSNNTDRSHPSLMEDEEEMRTALAAGGLWSTCTTDDVIKSLAPGNWVDGDILNLYLLRKWYDHSPSRVVYIPMEWVKWTQLNYLNPQMMETQKEIYYRMTLGRSHNESLPVVTLVHDSNHYFVALFDFARSKLVVYGKDGGLQGYRAAKLRRSSWGAEALWRTIADVCGREKPCPLDKVNVESWDFHQVRNTQQTS